jgi:hypothetical protein
VLVVCSKGTVYRLLLFLRSRTHIIIMDKHNKQTRPFTDRTDKNSKEVRPAQSE